MNVCYGCDGNSKYENKTEDHSHQYINMWGNVTTCWFIENHCFFSMVETIDYLIRTLECEHSEAMTYIHKMPRRYN